MYIFFLKLDEIIFIIIIIVIINTTHKTSVKYS